MDCGCGRVACVCGLEKTKFRTVERAAIWARCGELHSGILSMERL